MTRLNSSFIVMILKKKIKSSIFVGF